MVEPLELGRFISTCRKEKNLTQKQLGEELGVTDRAVSKWENGKSFPDISLIEPLCQILDISVSEFMLGKRIEPEHYQEETEKAWIASLDEPLLYKIQMIIYILGIAAVAVLQVPLFSHGPMCVNIICWAVWVPLLASTGPVTRMLPFSSVPAVSLAVRVMSPLLEVTPFVSVKVTEPSVAVAVSVVPAVR